MLLEYIAIGVMILVATLIAFIAIGLGELFGPKKKSAGKDTPYESGMDVIGDARQHFDVKFYLVAILFIIFDLEAAFLFPWAVSLKEIGWAGWATMMIFLAELAIGLVYAWKKGALDWE